MFYQGLGSIYYQYTTEIFPGVAENGLS